MKPAPRTRFLTLPPAGRLASIAGSINAITYNARGQATALAYANGASVIYGYDANRGWMTSVTAPNLSQAYTRDAKGRITGVSDAANPSRNWTYAYDTLDRLTSAIHNQNAASPDSRSYRYNNADSMVFNSGLCAGTADNITYPAQGAASVRPHAPSLICGVAPSYDANGNTLTYDPDGTGSTYQPRSFTYDGENRPIAVTSDAELDQAGGYTVYLHPDVRQQSPELRPDCDPTSKH